MNYYTSYHILKSKNRNNYASVKADANYRLRQTKSKPKGKYLSEICDEIQTLLLKTWSPEQLANTSINNKVSFKTLYNCLYSGLISKCDLSVLRQKDKGHNPA